MTTDAPKLTSGMILYLKEQNGMVLQQPEDSPVQE